MSLEIKISESKRKNLTPKILIVGIGGAGNNAISNLIRDDIENVDFIALNTDAQTLSHCLAKDKIQLGVECTQGLGAGAKPDVGKLAAEESLEDIKVQITNYNMIFIAAGMGGGTGTGAAPVVAKAAKELGILSIGVVTKPFDFEGSKRREIAEEGINNLKKYLDTLIVIPNQHLFRLSNNQTSLADAFRMADNVLCSGVRSITDLIMRPGLKNLDFNDVKTVMQSQGKALIGTGEASGDNRAKIAAEMAISNPLLEEIDIKEAGKVLINITSGLTLSPYELDEATNFIRERIDSNAEIHWGAGMDEALQDELRVAVIITGIENNSQSNAEGFEYKSDLDSDSVKTQSSPYYSGSSDTLLNAQKKYFAKKALIDQSADQNSSEGSLNHKNLYHSLSKEEIEQLEMLDQNSSKHNLSDENFDEDYDQDYDQEDFNLDKNSQGSVDETKKYNTENIDFVDDPEVLAEREEYRSAIRAVEAEAASTLNVVASDSDNESEMRVSNSSDTKNKISKESFSDIESEANFKAKTDSQSTSSANLIGNTETSNKANNLGKTELRTSETSRINDPDITANTFETRDSVKSSQQSDHRQESFDFANQPPQIDKSLLSSQSKSFFLEDSDGHNSSRNLKSVETETTNQSLDPDNILEASEPKEIEQKGFFKRIANKLFHSEAEGANLLEENSVPQQLTGPDLERNMIDINTNKKNSVNAVEDYSNHDEAAKIPAFLRKQANTIR